MIANVAITIPTSRYAPALSN